MRGHRPSIDSRLRAHPEHPATRLIAVIRFGCSGRASESIHRARSCIFGEYPARASNLDQKTERNPGPFSHGTGEYLGAFFGSGRRLGR
jgi:hypothetical protein